MGTEYTNQDEALDAVLKGLRNAPLPAGMESRIAQRLQQTKAASAAQFHPRDVFARTALAGAWWRGAATGAATAMLLAGALLFANHLLQPHAPPAQTTANNLAAAAPISPSAQRASANESRNQPCARPSVVRLHSANPAHPTDPLRAESYAENYAPSHPAPEMPLTADERALVRLAQTANVKDVGTLDPETEARLEEQDAAEFKRFFAPLFSPPSDPPAADTNE